MMDRSARARLYAGERNAAVSVDLDAVDAVHAVAVNGELHCVFAVRGVSVHVRVSESADALLDELHAAALLQTSQKERLEAALRQQ